MRILWVRAGGLWPLNTGGRLRSFHIINELARRHRVNVVTTHGALRDDPRGLARALSHCESVTSVAHTVAKTDSVRVAGSLLRSWASALPLDLMKWRISRLRRAVMCALATHPVDLCIADSMFSVVNIPRRGPVPVLVFARNAEHMIWRRLRDVEQRPWRRGLLEIEWRKMRRWEAKACSEARMVLTVSDVDLRVLSAAAPAARFHAVPTGVDTTYFRPGGPGDGAPRLVFTGSMDWRPNEDAVLYFMDAILPRIRSAMPATSLAVVGRNPSPRLQRIGARHGVTVTGTVDDVRPWVAAAAVSIVPLRIGGGTRLKIFEALAMGKAVVATSIGAEGLPLVAGRHFVRADDSEAFADGVVSLLRDPARRAELGAVGRELVERQFSWSCVARDFETRCRETIGADDDDAG